MRRPASSELLILACLVLAPAAPAAASDLREFSVGMPSTALPPTGYVDFACADVPDHKLAGWADWRDCPADTRGLRAVSFRYDEHYNQLARFSDDADGTKVGGHPVLVALLIGDEGRVDGLRITTDPSARLYLHKKAFLFSHQVMARFGEDGWQCQDAKPADGEEPLGGVFVKEHCEKVTADRHFLLDSALYRRTGEPLRNFVSGAELTILAQAAPAGLELSGAWVPATDGKGADVPLYLTIANHAEQPDTLMRVRCPVAQFTEKRTVDRGEGGAAGREVRSIPVPAHDTLALEAEGFHIVLLQTTQPLKVGDTFTCSLAFQQAGAQELNVVVKAP